MGRTGIAVAIVFSFILVVGGLGAIAYGYSQINSDDRTSSGSSQSEGDPGDSTGDELGSADESNYQPCLCNPAPEYAPSPEMPQLLASEFEHQEDIEGEELDVTAEELANRHEQQLESAGNVTYAAKEMDSASVSGQTISDDQFYKIDTQSGEWYGESYLLGDDDSETGERSVETIYGNESGLFVHRDNPDSDDNYYAYSHDNVGYDYESEAELHLRNSLLGNVPLVDLSADARFTHDGTELIRYRGDIDDLSESAEMPTAYSEITDFSLQLYVTSDGLVKGYHYYVNSTKPDPGATEYQEQSVTVHYTDLGATSLPETDWTGVDWTINELD